MGQRGRFWEGRLNMFKRGGIFWEGGIDAGRVAYICLIGVYSEKEGYFLGGSHAYMFKGGGIFCDVGVDSVRVAYICLEGGGVYFKNM